MLSSRLPTVLIARLLLGLLLVCNLTLCISWHGAAAREEATSPSLAMTSAASAAQPVTLPSGLSYTDEVVGTGPDLADAREVAYAAVGLIDLPGSHHRTDIARKAVEGAISLSG